MLTATPHVRIILTPRTRDQQASTLGERTVDRPDAWRAALRLALGPLPRAHGFETGIKEAEFVEGRVGIRLAQDDVVHDRDLDQLRGPLELPRDLDVLDVGYRIAEGWLWASITLTALPRRAALNTSRG
jgi:hypothetical protein